MKLYGYFRSSAAYRVRIALNLKGLPYGHEAVHLTREGGWQFREDYRAINPQKRVPSLALSSGEVLLQSLAIIDYLDETFLEPPLLPAERTERARVRAVSQIVACDIHPINNLAVLRYLKRELGQSQDAIDDWYRHWVAQGFDAVEALIAPGPYAFGAQVTLADLCLVPQVFNARRFNMDLSKYPRIAAAEAACQKLPAFDRARPENQPDAE